MDLQHHELRSSGIVWQTIFAGNTFWPDMEGHAVFVAWGNVGAAVSPVLEDCLEGPGTAIFTVVEN